MTTNNLQFFWKWSLYSTKILAKRFCNAVVACPILHRTLSSLLLPPSPERTHYLDHTHSKQCWDREPNLPNDTISLACMIVRDDLALAFIKLQTRIKSSDCMVFQLQSVFIQFK
eukprot:TRINITY_DN2708_c0_g2_i1.p2 TRINITY_DN2708_c0_g2~~TRINITY_DN2708_c0_g2_i1.p2  ORF type:complete len:114 (+),score=11.71 TRINITY_DN2708_c0_g2_i1:787-1128(+)